eukprot:4718077-Alexandrium_andersonii.AAC.1
MSRGICCVANIAQELAHVTCSHAPACSRCHTLLLRGYMAWRRSALATDNSDGGLLVWRRKPAALQCQDASVQNQLRPGDMQ